MLLLICNRELLFTGKRKDEDDMAKSTKTYEERIRALEKKEQESIEATKKLIAQRKELEKRKKAEESKKRTHRLCQIGGAVESVLGCPIEEEDVTQETHLFHDSIANNIAIAKPGASREEIMEAAKKASIHDFIMTLPKGYDTEVGELGDTLSGGEKQRIGIARAFLHECPLILLDEPTSNLDSLNEGIILKSLKESDKKKTVVLVSHRVSTMNVADVVYEMENGRIS